MLININQRRLVTIASGFLVFILLSVALGRFLGSFPTAEEDCKTRCSAQGMQGRLVYAGPATSKTSYKTAHSNCECF